MNAPPTSEHPRRKKSAKISLKTRSRHHMEAQGYVVTDTEQKIKFKGLTILRDAFGFGDLLYCGHGQIGLIQSTSTPNMNKRIQKILETDAAEVWLKSRGRIFVHGWRKERPSGNRLVWTVTEQEITL